MPQRTEYILFADETNKTPTNPYFCLGGLVIKRADYENILIPKINELKEKYFHKTSIIFHYTEMKNNKGEFQIFQNDSILRNNFWNSFSNEMVKIPFVTLGAYFNKMRIDMAYNAKSFSDYDVAFRYLLENYTHYLKENNGIGAVCLESRSFVENNYLEKTYYDYRRNGSVFFSPADTEKYLASLEFVIKGDNCIGLQVADIIPARLMRIINKQKDNYSLNKLFKEKLYCYGTELEDVLGLRNIL